jgi:putative colanic acid biosynthesis acetyltransferase WcaF
MVKRLIWHFISILFFKNGFFPFYSLKRTLLRIFGAKISKGVLVKPYVNIKYPWFLEIGDHTWIGEGVWIDNLGKLIIGKNVCISQGAMFLSGNHDYTKSTFNLRVNLIIVEDGVWIGAKSIVCGGVVCGSHSVLAVGSVASSSLEPYSIYRGNPACKLKDRIING